MLDSNKLKGKIIENGMTITKLSEMLGMNTSTFYRKMKNNSFEIGEADIIVEKLNLSKAEANAIFFGQIVA